MKTLIYSVLFVILVACNKKVEDPFVTTTSLAISGYHLEVAKSMGGETFFTTSQKVLSFDSINKKVTISGSSNEFYLNGVYSYRFYDTTVYIIDPRTWKNIPQDLHLLDIANFQADRLYVNEFSQSKLIVTADYITGISDDEVEYDFVFK